MKVFESLDELKNSVFTIFQDDADCEKEFHGQTPLVENDPEMWEVGDDLMEQMWDMYMILKDSDIELKIIISECTTSDCVAEVLWDNNLVYKKPFVKHGFGGVEEVLSLIWFKSREDFYDREAIDTLFKDLEIEVEEIYERIL